MLQVLGSTTNRHRTVCPTSQPQKAQSVTPRAISSVQVMHLGGAEAHAGCRRESISSLAPRLRACQASQNQQGRAGELSSVCFLGAVSMGTTFTAAQTADHSFRISPLRNNSCPLLQLVPDPTDDTGKVVHGLLTYYSTAERFKRLHVVF